MAILYYLAPLWLSSGLAGLLPKYLLFTVNLFRSDELYTGLCNYAFNINITVVVRDIQMLIQSLLQAMFFLSPILWDRSSNNARLDS